MSLLERPSPGLAASLAWRSGARQPVQDGSDLCSSVDESEAKRRQSRQGCFIDRRCVVAPHSDSGEGGDVLDRESETILLNGIPSSLHLGFPPSQHPDICQPVPSRTPIAQCSDVSADGVLARRRVKFKPSNPPPSSLPAPCNSESQIWLRGRDWPGVSAYRAAHALYLASTCFAPHPCRSRASEDAARCSRGTEGRRWSNREGKQGVVSGPS